MPAAHSPERSLKQSSADNVVPRIPTVAVAVSSSWSRYKGGVSRAATEWKVPSHGMPSIAPPLIFETRGLPRSKDAQANWGESMDRFRGYSLSGGDPALTDLIAGQVHVMSPTVRKRTLICSTTSPGRTGVTSVIATSRPAPIRRGGAGDG